MKKMFSIFKNMKIKTKLFIVYFLTMSFTIAIIYSVSAVKINGVLLNQASNSLSASTLQINDNILNFVISRDFKGKIILSISNPMCSVRKLTDSFGQQVQQDDCQYQENRY